MSNRNGNTNTAPINGRARCRKQRRDSCRGA